MRDHRHNRGWRMLRACLAVWLLMQSGMPAANLAEAAPPPPKLKVRGYLTARFDDTTVAILDDQIHCGSAKIVAHDSSGDRPTSAAELAIGMLVEAEGIWTGHHQFAAEKVTVDEGLLERQIHETAYLQEEPKEADKIKNGVPAELKADGESLLVDSKTKRSWAAPAPAVTNASDTSAAKTPDNTADAGDHSSLAGYRVEYHGTRLADGKISTERVELGAPAPADAYKMPHGLEVVPAKDPQTGIDVLEFRRGKKVDGRMKLFPDKTVQTYVSDLGDSLLPAGSKGTTKALEFRFFVIEDSSINAAALPDGTILVNTALLGAVENEAQLAFILSHEISHVLQVHSWREVHETRPQRIGLLIAGIAAGAFIGDLGVFMAELGMISVINGHQRELENQADRLGLQNVIERGYDPRPAPGFMRITLERYGTRTTSKLWSNHDSALLRGSFLTAQLIKQYPDHHFDGKRVNTAAFDDMHDALGPVRIE
jgi:peptidase M48-like protein